MIDSIHASRRSQGKGGNLLDQVRNSARLVAESAKHVRINQEKINSYVLNLPIDTIKNPPLDPEVHYLQQGADTIAYFLTLETINFGSGYFPHLENPTGESGYFLVAKSLKEHYVKNGPISASDLTRLSGQDCAKMFHQSWENAPIRELMTLFAQALNELGHFLLQEFQGRFDALLESARQSVIHLMDLLIQIPSFNDVATYGELKVPFLKRAQITAADISLAFSHQGAGYFKDLHLLTIFADNQVPHVLRCDGLLSYHEDLSSMIDRGELLPAGSPEEIEIRACAIHTVELIKQAFQERGQHFTSVELDYLLWNRGLAASYQKECLVHTTRTIYY